MKKVVMDEENPFLPEEIMTNILKRLPVKSLIRFQCVCKPWKNLFKTPSFIADHLHHSSHQNPFILFEAGGESDPLRLYLVDRDMQVLEVQNDPFVDSMWCIWPVNSCNGLLCFELTNFDKSHSILLWNPAIREVIHLPKAVNFSEDGDFYIGFGFSPIVNDYKVVRFYVSGTNDSVHQVEVYSLSTGSWKEVEFGNLDGVALGSNGFTFNGAIFWFGSKPSSEEDYEEDIHLLVSFDIETEVFTLILIPDSAVTPYRNNLTVYENKLVLLSYTISENFESSMIDLWMMEEGSDVSGERRSWIKKYTSIPYPGLLLVPITIWRNEVVCNVEMLPGPVKYDENDEERKTVMFNLATNEFKRFVIRKRGLEFDIFNYVESLVPVGNFQNEQPLS